MKCIDLRLCISPELSEYIEKYQAKMRLSGKKLTKPKAAEKLFEELTKPLMK